MFSLPPVSLEHEKSLSASASVMAQKALFKKYSRYSVRMRQTDQHDLCLLCLGEDHASSSCKACLKFNSKTWGKRALKLKVALWENAFKSFEPLDVIVKEILNLMQHVGTSQLASPPGDSWFPSQQKASVGPLPKKSEKGKEKLKLPALSKAMPCTHWGAGLDIARGCFTWWLSWSRATAWPRIANAKTGQLVSWPHHLSSARWLTDPYSRSPWYIPKWKWGQHRHAGPSDKIYDWYAFISSCCCSSLCFLKLTCRWRKLWTLGF